MSNLLPGFRFYPTEEEMVEFYLRNKLERRRDSSDRVIPVVDIYNDLDPWQLPNLAGELCAGDSEQWIFFSPRQERKSYGGRPNRITPSGYWKATGSPTYVFSSTVNRMIGVKKTMVFYQGRAPTGTKTKWKVNEYKAFEETPTSGASPRLRQEISLCRVYVNSGSLRSFDRRPLAASTSGGPEENTRMVPNTMGPAGSSLGASHQENASVVDGTGSPESSSSGDQVHNSQTQGAVSDWNMIDNMDGPWDSFNWDC